MTILLSGSFLHGNLPSITEKSGYTIISFIEIEVDPANNREKQHVFKKEDVIAIESEAWTKPEAYYIEFKLNTMVTGSTGTVSPLRLGVTVPSKEDRDSIINGFLELFAEKDGS